MAWLTIDEAIRGAGVWFNDSTALLDGVEREFLESGRNHRFERQAAATTAAATISAAAALGSAYKLRIRGRTVGSTEVGKLYIHCSASFVLRATI
jgi:hypothetical protein